MMLRRAGRGPRVSALDGFSHDADGHRAWRRFGESSADRAYGTVATEPRHPGPILRIAADGATGRVVGDASGYAAPPPYCGRSRTGGLTASRVEVFGVA